MARRPVVLGYPLSMAVRGIKSNPLAGAVTLGAGAAAIGTVSYVAPWIKASSEGNLVPKDITSTSITDVSTLTDVLGGVLTFLDMNAEVIEIEEKRRMAVISIPGRESDFLQDLGGHTTTYQVKGKFYDTDPQYLSQRGIMQTILKTVIQSSAVGSTQLLRMVMRSRSPVPFISQHEISFAVITHFRFNEVGGAPEWCNYEMRLLEYRRIPYLAKMAILGTGNWISNLTGS